MNRKRFFSIVLAVVSVLSMQVPAFAASMEPVEIPVDIEFVVPDDVEAGRWSYDYIVRAVFGDWMDIDSTGFRPTEPVSYGTFCRALAKGVLLQPGAVYEEESTLPSWYKCVSDVAAAGALADTAMADPETWDEHVDDVVDRSTMATILGRVVRHVGLIDPNTGCGAGGGEFDEMTPSAVQGYLECKSLGILSGYPDGRIGHADPMTREQCAKVVCILADLAHGDVPPADGSMASVEPAG